MLPLILAYSFGASDDFPRIIYPQSPPAFLLSDLPITLLLPTYFLSKWESFYYLEVFVLGRVDQPAYSSP
jgi:hypothetical protein